MIWLFLALVSMLTRSKSQGRSNCLPSCRWNVRTCQRIRYPQYQLCMIPSIHPSIRVHAHKRIATRRQRQSGRHSKPKPRCYLRRQVQRSMESCAADMFSTVQVQLRTPSVPQKPKLTEIDHYMCRYSCSTSVSLSRDGCPGFPMP